MGFRDLRGVLKAEARPEPTHPSSNDLLKVQLEGSEPAKPFPPYTMHTVGDV